MSPVCDTEHENNYELKIKLNLSNYPKTVVPTVDMQTYSASLAQDADINHIVFGCIILYMLCRVASILDFLKISLCYA